MIGLAVALCSAPILASAQDFEVRLTASKSVIEPDQTFIYSVEIRNISGIAAEEIELLLVVDDAIEILSVSGGGRRGGDGAQWRDLSLPAGASRSFTVSARAEDNAEDGKTLYATAVAGGGFAEATVTVENEDDENNDDDRRLSVDMFADRPQVEPGEPFVLKVEIENLNSKKVTDVDVTVELDENIEILSTSNRGSGGDGELSWTGLELKGHEVRTLTASARIAEDADQCDELTSTVYTEGAVFEHTVPVWDPDLNREPMHVFIAADSDEVMPGDTITYTIRVRNMGNEDGNVDVHAYIDPRTTFESASEEGEQFDETLVLWTRAPVEEDETSVFTVTVLVDDNVFPGAVLRFSALAGLGRQEVITLVSAEPMQNEERNVLSSTQEEQVEASQSNSQEDTFDPSDADISVEQEADKDEVQPGSLMSFTILVTNEGEDAVKGLTVEETFSASDLTVRDANGGSVQGGRIRWTIANLAAGQTWEKTYRARIAESVEHGTVLEREVTVSIDGETVADSGGETDVIENLPQAGIGTFAFAVEQVRASLRPVHAGAMETPEVLSQKTSTPVTLPRALWLLGIVGGIGAGGFFAWRRAAR
jgi:uncharacterized repeat protein (TIGR01451 family)